MPVPEGSGKQTKRVQTGEGLSTNVIKYVKLIYLHLINPDELPKYLHGKTQNQNESFYAMIWVRAPKNTCCANEKLELAVYDVLADFNGRKQAAMDIFLNLNINP